MVRHWILSLVVLVNIHLYGNLFLFNLLLVYPNDSDHLPLKFKADSQNRSRRALPSPAPLQPEPARSRAVPSFNVRGFLSRTTAHPVPDGSPFLATSESAPATTGRTRAPPQQARKAHGPPVLLTNPALSTPTTTPTTTTTTTTTTTSATSTPPAPSSPTTTRDQPRASHGRSLADAHPTEPSKPGLWSNRDWTRLGVELLLLLAPGLGLLVGCAPLTWLLRRNGARAVLGFALLASALLIVLQPAAIQSEVVYLIPFRMAQGVTCAPVLPLIGVNAAEWGSVKEQLLFLSICFGSLLFAPALWWMLTVRVLHNSIENVHALHYFFGSVTLIVAFLWLLFYRNSPQKHRFVNGIELNRISTGKSQQNNRLLERSVVSLLLRSYSCWSVLVASYAYFFAFALFATFLPIYLLKVLRVQKLASTHMCTFLLPAVVHVISILLDKSVSGCSAKLKSRFFNGLSLAVTALLLLALAALPPNEHFAYNSSWLLLSVLTPLGFSTLGFIYHTVVYGRFFAQHLISLMVVPFGLSLVIAPSLTLFLTVDNLTKYWRLTFLITSAWLLFGVIVFATLSRGQPARWAEHSWDPVVSTRMTDVQPITTNEECGLLELKTFNEQHDSKC